MYVCPLSRRPVLPTIDRMTKSCVRFRGLEGCPLCYSGKKGRQTYAGHFGFHKPPSKKEKKWMALQRSRSSGSGSVGPEPPVDLCAWSLNYPTVVEFLSLRRWPDGALRQSGTVTLMWELGLWKAALNDRDGGVSCFTSGKTLTSLWEALETGLVEQSLEWREKKDYSSPKKRTI